MPMPALARSFRDLKFGTEIGSLSGHTSIRMKRMSKRRRTSKAEHSFFFKTFLMRRRLNEIRAADGFTRPAHNLFHDMLDSEALKTYVRESREHGNELYAALCNNDWVKNGEIWFCSMRGAGRITADLRNKYEWYLDFYCSGNESDVSPEISKLLGSLGWHLAPERADEEI